MPKSNFRFGGIADMAGLADGSTWSRMTHKRTLSHGDAGRTWNCVMSDTTVHHLDDPVAAACQMLVMGNEQEARPRIAVDLVHQLENVVGGF
jgi:hypothetical protein